MPTGSALRELPMTGGSIPSTIVLEGEPRTHNGVLRGPAGMPAGETGCGRIGQSDLRKAYGCLAVESPANPALVVLVPEAEASVGRLRQRYDPSAAVGMPAHITLNYPFLLGEPTGTEMCASVSHREGNFKIYPVSPEGGGAMRLTLTETDAFATE